MEFNIKKGDFSSKGATKTKNYINFCIPCRKESECSILLYEREKSLPTEEIVIGTEYSKGNLRAVRIYGFDCERYDYNFKIDGEVCLDSYVTRIVGREKWADTTRLPDVKETLRCRVQDSNFSWRADAPVEIARKDMVLYKLHMRGFTMGLANLSDERGTFKGFIKKIPYLKSLGVTTVEFMPVYEFEELIVEKRQEIPEYLNWTEKKQDKIKKQPKKQEYKVNFWGYGEGCYFAPKASYAATDHPSSELKECIVSLHKRGMECILEMHFADDIPKQMILDVLHYWVDEYHVDGFHLQGNRIPIDLIIEDEFLGRTKIFYRNMPYDMIADMEKEYPRLFVDNDEYLYPARKLLNGMNGNIWEFADQMKKQNQKLGFVNYVADNNGFTLADLFTYEMKHNEANGENNTDGLAWNFSSNCGVEGETTSRNVLKIRERKMRNAIAMLFLSQGVPMILAGDEDCNSQNGNNNAYCQDNEIGYKDWKQTKAAKDFTRFVKKMIEFRKNHLIVRKEGPMRLEDYRAVGFPDLSYHEDNAWITASHYNRRAMGMLYCGTYAEEEEDVYIGFNFSEFRKKLALPKQRKKRKWYLHMDSSAKMAFLPQPVEMEENYYVLEAQSICILIGK